PVYLFLREFSLQDFRGGSKNSSLITVDLLLALPTLRPEK
ncbi:tail fiber domain-containing protein, partial [Shigella boydii]